MDYGNLEIEQKTYEIPKEGMRNAVCCGVWDVGLQENTYKGETKRRQEIIVGFQVEDKHSVDGVQLSIYTWPISKYVGAKKTKVLIDALNKGPLESFKDLIGKRCLLQISHTTKDGKTNANIVTVNPPLDDNKLVVEPFEELPGRVKWARDKAVDASKPETPKEEEPAPLAEVIPDEFNI